jgi:hypothetical protein
MNRWIIQGHFWFGSFVFSSEKEAVLEKFYFNRAMSRNRLDK